MSKTQHYHVSHHRLLNLAIEDTVSSLQFHQNAPIFQSGSIIVIERSCVIVYGTLYAATRPVVPRSTLHLKSHSHPDTHYRPCLNQSPSFAFPNCARLFMPCSLRSMPFNCATSCAGALLTRVVMIRGSVSRMIPSSTISSIASDTRS